MIKEDQPIRVCHASFSNIRSDQRILREISTLCKLNYSVSTVGYDDGVKRREFTHVGKLIRAIRQIPANFFSVSIVSRLYWLNPECREAFSSIVKTNATIIHAHDWEVLPAASRAANQLGAIVIYDSHEIASDMRKEHLLWRIAYTAFIQKLESKHIPDVKHVITVGDFCADHFQSEFSLPTKPVVLRNLPNFGKYTPSKTDTEDLMIHYHGNIISGRGLVNTVNLLAQLPDRFRLRITGRENQVGYCRRLKKLAKKLGCLDRVEINPALPYKALFSHANDADIGIFIPNLNSAHGTGAAPNKYYEYMMSGLMLLANDTQEAQSLVKEHRVGLTFGADKLKYISKKLTSLTTEEISRYKENSIVAAKELCWENEQSKLLNLYKSALNP